MNKLTLYKGRVSKDIIVNNVKYIAVNTNSDYWFYNRCFHSINSNLSFDCKEQSDNSICVKIDDEPISKTDEIIFVNHLFNLEDDLKMGSKSLSLKYVSSIIEQSSFSDELLQLNSMLRVYTEYITSSEFLIEGIELNQKSLPKIITMSILSNYSVTNSYNLTYDQIIILQLKLIVRANTQTKRKWVIIELIELTSTIKRFIDSIENMKIIVIFSKTSVLFKEFNIYWNSFDLENDEELYERMNNMSEYYSLDDYKHSLLVECNDQLKI